MEIFKWLDDSSFVKDYTIHDFRESSETYYLNIKVHFTDTSILYIKEFVEPARRKYAFHWQKENGDLIIQWDNAPHFQQLSSFPHHKHVGPESVEVSYDISLADILKFIKERIA